MAVVNLYDELPEFANQENIEIHAKVLIKGEELSNLISTSEELSDRISVLKEHLKQVKTSLKTSQDVFSVQRQKADSEAHLCSLDSREMGKLQAEMRKDQEEVLHFEELRSDVSKRITVAQDRFDELKNQKNLNEEQLEQWMKAARDKEEDYLVLLRYQREDDASIKNLLKEMESGQGVIQAKRLELDHEATNTRALQTELDIVAQQFRDLHEERTDILNKWEQTLREMQRLNLLIEAETVEFQKRKNVAYEAKARAKGLKKEVENAEQQNKQMERECILRENDISKKNVQIDTYSSKVHELQQSVEELSKHLGKLESDAIYHIEQTDEYIRKEAIMIERKEQYKQRLVETQNASLTLVDHMNEINEVTNQCLELIKKDTAVLQDIEKKIKEKKKDSFKLGQEVLEARKNEKNLLSEIDSSKSRVKAIQSRINEFDKETKRQMELVYASNFQIQQMQKRIAKLQGELSEQEIYGFQEELKSLNSLYQVKAESEKMMNQQMIHLNNDIRATKVKRLAREKIAGELATKLNELSIDQNSLDVSVAKCQDKKEEFLVRINLLKLHGEKLIKQLHYKADEVTSLENRKEQLYLSLEERVSEIDSYISTLKTQLKLEEEARHNAIVEVQERKKREEALASKYEVVMGVFQSEGGAQSQTEQMVKFSRDRDDLSRKGDELDKDVQVKIQELKSLERTLAKLNGGNMDFKMSFSRVQPDHPDIERKKYLEEQKKLNAQKLNLKRNETQNVARERASVEKTFQDQHRSIDKIQKQITKMNEYQQKITNENNSLKEKLSRANKAYIQAMHNYRQASGIPNNAEFPSCLFEMDIAIKILQQNSDKVVEDLEQFCEANREVEPMLRNGFNEIGIKSKISRMPLVSAPVSPNLRTQNLLSNFTKEHFRPSTRLGMRVVSDVPGAVIPPRSNTAAGKRVNETTSRKPKVFIPKA